MFSLLRPRQSRQIGQTRRDRQVRRRRRQFVPQALGLGGARLEPHVCPDATFPAQVAPPPAPMDVVANVDVQDGDVQIFVNSAGAVEVYLVESASYSAGGTITAGTHFALRMLSDGKAGSGTSSTTITILPDGEGTLENTVTVDNGDVTITTVVTGPLPGGGQSITTVTTKPGLGWFFQKTITAANGDSTITTTSHPSPATEAPSTTTVTTIIYGPGGTTTTTTTTEQGGTSAQVTVVKPDGSMQHYISPIPRPIQ